MPVTFAFQCDVLPGRGQTTAALLEQLLVEARDWFERISAPAPGEVAEGPEEIAVHRETLEGKGLVGLEWGYVYEKDPTITWTVECLLAEGDRAVGLAVSLAFRAERFELRPGPNSTVLSLAREVLEKYRCEINGMPVPTSPRQLTAADVPRFVRNQLTSPKRTIPVVILAPHPTFGALAAPPEPLQQRLLGFVEVVALQDHAAWGRLVEAVGQPLATPAGGARLYWPGFDLGADPKRHPWMPPDRLQKLAEEGRADDLDLLPQLVGAAVSRFYPVRIAGRNWQEGLSAKANRAAQAERDRLTQQNATLTSELTNLKVELARCRKALARAEAATAARRHRADAGPAAAKRDAPATVAAALAQAAIEFADILTVWDTATQSAGSSESSHGGPVSRALSAIADVARALFRDGPDALGPLDQAFAARVPYKYTSHESTTTLGLFGQRRVFHHRGRTLQMQRHLTLARGDRKNCVQIYFEFDHDDRRAHVGYCGKHLPIARRPT